MTKIAFMGKMGSGKTTAAKYLVHSHGFVKLSFADPVKIATAQMLNQLQAYLHVYSDRPIEAKEWTLASIDEAKKHPTIRHLLQFVGTELGREYIGYENLWIDMLLRDAEHLNRVVNDDLRFPNEADALRNAGFTIVKIIREVENTSHTATHVSETALDNYKPDMVVYNNGDETFFTNLDLMMSIVPQENTRLREQ